LYKTLKLQIFLFAFLLAGSSARADYHLSVQVLQNDNDPTNIDPNRLHGLNQTLSEIVSRLNPRGGSLNEVPWFVLLTQSSDVRIEWNAQERKFISLDDQELSDRQSRWRKFPGTAGRENWSMVSVTQMGNLLSEQDRFRFALNVLFSDVPFESEWGILRDRNWFRGEQVLEDFFRIEPLAFSLQKFLVRSETEKFPEMWVHEARNMLGEVRKTYEALLPQFVGLAQHSREARRWDTVIPVTLAPLPAGPHAHDLNWLISSLAMPMMKKVHLKNNWNGLFQWSASKQRYLFGKSVEIVLTDKPLKDVGVCAGNIANWADNCPFAIKLEREKHEITLKVFLSLDDVAISHGSLRTDRIARTLVAIARAVGGPIRNFLEMPLERAYFITDESVFLSRLEEVKYARAILRAAYEDPGVWPSKRIWNVAETGFLLF
jgi:hypothetical protein